MLRVEHTVTYISADRSLMVMKKEGLAWLGSGIMFVRGPKEISDRLTRIQLVRLAHSRDLSPRNITVSYRLCMSPGPADNGVDSRMDCFRA